MSEKSVFVEQKFEDMIQYTKFLHEFCREGGDFHCAIRDNGGNPQVLDHVRHHVRLLTGVLEKSRIDI